MDRGSGGQKLGGRAKRARARARARTWWICRRWSVSVSVVMLPAALRLEARAGGGGDRGHLNVTM